MPRKSQEKRSKAKTCKSVIIQNKYYGKMNGLKVYYEGKRPKIIKKDGSFAFGKHILEICSENFERFRLIITPSENKISKEYGIYRVRISQKLLAKMNSESYARTRDIKVDIVRQFLSITFPTQFSQTRRVVYIPGTISTMLDKKIIPRLSSEDKDAIINFLPDFVSSESHASVNLLKATTEIQSLKELSALMRESMNESRSESWWQTFIKKNILIIQQGYIQPIEKMNIAIGKTKFPDFSLVTHDNYLDILEIKKANTKLLTADSSRGNYYWSTELSKSIIQTENYISTVSKHSDAIRSYLKDTFEIDIQILKPRGIILAGNTSEFENRKQKDDFRLLSQSLKNITVLSYDELLVRLENYIKVLESFSTKKNK